MQKEIKQKKQDLGIFYTDKRIVSFIFDILKIWKEREDKETGRWESKKHCPSVIDPAVGEGAFLKVAVQSGFTKTDYIFGLDIDEDVVKKWKDINLLKEFGGKKDDLEAHFFHQNGLDKIHWEQHINKYKYKLKQKDIDAQQFDAVVGNPPYGGVGLGEIELTDDLVLQLANFEVLPENVKNNLIFANTQTDLFNSDKQLAIKPDAKQRIKAFAIETLFLERFIQLAKAGGWIAVVIPDGILTNSNSHYVREFISQKAKVEAIISLPRDAFKNAGTSAKTSILFLQKYKDQEEKQKDYSVFLASVDSLDEKNFNLVKDNYRNYYNKTMSNKNLVQTTTDEKGREIVMVRVDKTLKEMMEEKPASRWNAEYWHQKYVRNLETLKESKFKIGNIGQFENKLTYGAIITGKKDYSGKDVFLVNQGDIDYTGLNLVSSKIVKKDSPWVIERAKLKDRSILFARSGVAGVGKNRITIAINPPSAVVDSFVDILDLNKEINPFYVLVFWKSVFGWLQVERFINGVGTLNISFDEVRAMQIPIILESIQNHIESEYKKMSKYHDKAMEAKKNNKEAEYKKNIEIAQKMLKDLIAKTESVIRGERKDVI